jgi:ParB family chromosome partitioning protein
MTRQVAIIPNLDELAARIVAEHDSFILSMKRGVEHAIRCGLLLIEAKSKMTHGQWLPWLKNHCPESLPKRTASHYMRLARNAPALRADAEAKGQRVANMGVREAMRLLAPPADTVTGTGDDEWYTPFKYIESARAVMGAIDLDPASCDFAQEAVKASSYYTKDDNGLQLEWHGRVWLNPPYSKELMPLFVDKLIQEYGEHRRVKQAIMLTNNYTENQWFQKAEKLAERICFTDHRVKFQKEEPEVTGSAPQRGNCFFYFGDDARRFESEFSQWGFVR